MKKLEDLKKEVVSKDIRNFYVFYGEDYGIRKHYINEIGKSFKRTIYLDTYNDVQNYSSGMSLFDSGRKLLVIYNDEEFLKLKINAIQQFIESIKDCSIIFVYEVIPETTSLFKDFTDYITYFPEVQDNIGKEFVNSELKVMEADAEQIASNCNNNYNMILLESDKIKEYAQASKITDKGAFDVLDLKEQLVKKVDVFDVGAFMIDVLTDNRRKIPYWYNVAKNDVDRFFSSLVFMFNDFLIAGLLTRFGTYNGGKIAYENKLSWTRTKILRELYINADAEYLFDTAYMIACIDTEVKSGKIERDKVVDYFFSSVI